MCCAASRTPDVTHVEGRIDPLADAETVETELMLADLESVEKRLAGLQRKLKGGDKEAAAQARLLEAAKAALEAGRPARTVAGGGGGRAGLADAAAADRRSRCSTSATSRRRRRRPATRSRRRWRSWRRREGAGCVVISAAIEEEIAQLDDAERAEFLEALGLRGGRARPADPRGLPAARAATYFTAGPKEARAWTIPEGASAPQAAGVIHGDFERGFIRAETVAYDDYVALGGEAGAREAGRLRAEGKAYRVQDGDVLHFLFNA